MPWQVARTFPDVYLCIYNICMAVGWASTACIVIVGQAREHNGFRAASRAAYLLQALSVLETLHARLKLVNSGVLFNALQWVGRAHALFVVVAPEPEVQASPAAAMMLAFWGVGEACRYPWYAANNMGKRPYALEWLRYSAFVPIYPLGLCAELACIWSALPLVQATGRLSLALPNPLNIAFHYPTFLRAVLFVQPLAWTLLYATLLQQRARRLRSLPSGKRGGIVRTSVSAEKKASATDEAQDGESPGSDRSAGHHVRAWHPSAPVQRGGAS